MGTAPTKEHIIRLIADLEPNLPLDECHSCECYLALLTQLSLDVDLDVAELRSHLHLEREQSHSCLGCQPCPPADGLALYLKSNGPCC